MGVEWVMWWKIMGHTELPGEWDEAAWYVHGAGSQGQGPHSFLLPEPLSQVMGSE